MHPPYPNPNPNPNLNPIPNPNPIPIPNPIPNPIPIPNQARLDILRQSTDLDEEASSALLLQLAELDRHDAQQRMEDELPRQEAALQARERLLREIDAGIRIPTHRSSYT